MIQDGKNSKRARPPKDIIVTREGVSLWKESKSKKHVNLCILQRRISLLMFYHSNFDMHWTLIVPFV